MANAMTTDETVSHNAQLLIDGEYSEGYTGMLVMDNGEHPGGPYIDYYEHELDGTYGTIDEVREAARQQLQAWEDDYIDYMERNCP